MTRTDVPAAFDRVASTYDLMVGLNPGYHAQLRRSAGVLVAELPPVTRRPVRVVDLGCGSGASTVALQRALCAAGVDHELIGVDGSARMLDRARRKLWRNGWSEDRHGAVRFVLDDAERLDPSRWADGPVDAVFAAYLVRNVSARDELLRRVRDLLVPGGVLVLHEYSVRDDPWARVVWDLVSWGVVVPLGLLTAPRSRIYRYLWRSVVDFDGIDGLRRRLQDAGFVDVRSRSFGGWQRGVLHTVLARRPPSP